MDNPAYPVGQKVTVSANLAPFATATNPLRDESELDAPGFTGRTVTNNTGNTPATGDRLPRMRGAN